MRALDPIQPKLGRHTIIPLRQATANHLSDARSHCQQADAHLRQAEAKHQIATDKFDTARSSVYELLEENPFELPHVVASLLELEEAGSIQQECSAFLVRGLQETVSALHNTQEQIAKLNADAADAKFLATYRDPIRKWFTRRAKALGMDWQTLAGKLDLEEDDLEEGAELDSPSCTEQLKASLRRDDYSWQDWLDIRSIADAANSTFHLGKKISPQDALLNLDQNAQKLPESLRHAKAPLRKALASLIKR